MIYKIKHGDAEYSVIAGSLKTAQQWVRSHHGEPVVVNQQQDEPESIEQEIFDDLIDDMFEDTDAGNQD